MECYHHTSRPNRWEQVWETCKLFNRGDYPINRRALQSWSTEELMSSIPILRSRPHIALAIHQLCQTLTTAGHDTIQGLFSTSASVCYLQSQFSIASRVHFRHFKFDFNSSSEPTVSANSCANDWFGPLAERQAPPPLWLQLPRSTLDQNTMTQEQPIIVQASPNLSKRLEDPRHAATSMHDTVPRRSFFDLSREIRDMVYEWMVEPGHYVIRHGHHWDRVDNRGHPEFAIWVSKLGTDLESHLAYYRGIVHLVFRMRRQQSCLSAIRVSKQMRTELLDFLIKQQGKCRLTVMLGDEQFRGGMTNLFPDVVKHIHSHPFLRLLIRLGCEANTAEACRSRLKLTCST